MAGGGGGSNTLSRLNKVQCHYMHVFLNFLINFFENFKMIERCAILILFGGWGQMQIVQIVDF